MEMISWVVLKNLLLEFEMIRVFFFVSVLLSCLPLLHSVNISMPICPESFHCPDLPPLKYPFYNVTDTQCGLIKVNCTSKGGEVQFGRQSYEIVGKYDSDDNYSYNIVIRNKTFEELVKNNSCEALMNDLTPLSPSPLLYSISILPNITLFKCTKNLTSAQQQIEAYFYSHGYQSYNTCKDYAFYYNYFNGTVPSGPHACQVVQLPVKLSSSPGIDETNIFSLLSSHTSIFFNLSPSCHNCYKKGLRCYTNNGDVQCSDAIKEIPDREQTPTSISNQG